MIRSQAHPGLDNSINAKVESAVCLTPASCWLTHKMNWETEAVASQSFTEQQSDVNQPCLLRLQFDHAHLSTLTSSTMNLALIWMQLRRPSMRNEYQQKVADDLHTVTLPHVFPIPISTRKQQVAICKPLSTKRAIASQAKWLEALSKHCPNQTITRLLCLSTNNRPNCLTTALGPKPTGPPNLT